MHNLKFTDTLFSYIIISVLTLSSSILAQSGLTVDIEQIDANNFPFIFTTVTVENNGVSIPDLNISNFTVKEDGRVQNDYFDVIPPNVGGGVRLVDFVFLIDNSGSMSNEIAAVRNNVNSFVTQLSAQGYDIRLGAVRFGQSTNGGAPEIYNGGILTNNLTTFHSWINQMSATGGYEPGLLAIYQAATTFNFRPGSQRHFLLITDEDSDAGNLQQTISTCLSGNIVVHAAVDCNFYYPSAFNHYCSSTSISGATGGMVFTVSGPYNGILDAIGQAITNTYIVRYKTDNPAYDGQQRTVEISVTHNSNNASKLGYYTPGAGPTITLTSETANYLYTPAVQGSNLLIAANVVDNIPPYVTSVSLYYKKVGQLNFIKVNMVNTGGGRYAANIPGSDVITPGVQFYITATDGQLTSSLPKEEPGINPFNIAVLPNYPPLILHTPIATAAPNTAVAINAFVTDQTYALAEVKLYYRKTGTLIYNSVSMVNLLGDTYSATIPQEFVVTGGVEYYIRAVDDLGIYTMNGPHSVEVNDADTDGDGLLDSWEIYGYDADGDGVIDVDLPAMGANYLRKDIFVEVDWMGAAADGHNHYPDPSAIQLVIDAFANAPVNNPDGSTGISVHVDVGQLGGGNEIPHDDVLGTGFLGTFLWSEFNQVKNANFDESRKKIFHYCIFAHDYAFGNGSSGLSRGIPSSDFIVSLGTGWSRTKYEQAGTFMHELGHNLGLKHGGGDHRNHKPNYLSIMNYSFQLGGLFFQGNIGKFDYSRWDLPLLDENELNETIGLNGGAIINEFGTAYYEGEGKNANKIWVLKVNDPIDWNNDGDYVDNNLSQNINRDSFLGLPWKTELKGFDDWSNIVFDGGTIGAGISLPLPDETEIDELTLEEAMIMKPIPVSGLTANTYLGYIELIWNTYDNGELTGFTYNLYRKDEAAYNLLQENANQPFRDHNAVSGLRNYYTVKISNPYGTESDAYEVVSILTHNFLGFSPPMHKTTWRKGATIPIKFQLQDTSGVYISNAETEIYLTPVDDNGNPIGPTIPGEGRGNIQNTFRYDELDNQYIFNLITENLFTGDWEIKVLIDDGTTHRATITIR